MKAGDVLVEQAADHSWHAVKILAIDAWPDGGQVFHCMFYEPAAEKPDAEAIQSMPVAVWHAPMAAQAYRQGWELLCSMPVQESELEGFHEYLKLTDFSRYATETGQDLQSLISQANDLYQQASALGDAGEREKAIDLYAKAVDIFPLFFEAIDNRAFTLMELGDYAAALAGFEASFRINPDGHVAFFSRGECLMELGILDQAIAVFEDGATRFPEHRDIYLRFLAQARMRAKEPGAMEVPSLSKTRRVKVKEGGRSRPWWRFWKR